MDSGLKLVSRTGTFPSAGDRNRAVVFDQEFAGVPVPCVRVDSRGVVVSANAAAVGLLHLPRTGEAPTLASFVQAPDMPRYHRFVQEANSVSRLCEATLRFRCGNGRARSIQVHAGATASQGQGVVLSLIDVTPRVEVAEQLAVAEASIRGLLAAIPQPVFVVAGGEVVANNTAAADLVGRDPLGTPLANFVGRGQQATLRCCLDTDWVAGSIQRLDIVFSRPSAPTIAAETLWLSFSFEGRRASLCLVQTDSGAAVREVHEADCERLAAIGGAASALGHTLNNALTCLGMTIGELSERALSDPEQAPEADSEELIDAVTDALERMAGGVRQLQGIVRLTRGEDDRLGALGAAGSRRATRALRAPGENPAGPRSERGRAQRPTQEVRAPDDRSGPTIDRTQRVTRELPPITEKVVVDVDRNRATRELPAAAPARPTARRPRQELSPRDVAEVAAARAEYRAHRATRQLPRMDTAVPSGKSLARVQPVPQAQSAVDEAEAEADNAAREAARKASLAG